MSARLSKRLLLVNVLLLGVALFFGVTLAREATRSRPLPPPPAPRRAPAAAPSEEAPAAPPEEKLATYSVIVSRPLFNPSRSEGAPAAAAPVAPPQPKPMLLGVVVDPDPSKSRAYLEDATNKRVFGYKVGDAISGGRVEQITDEKVVITGRPDGVVEVLLRDPSKPKPVAGPGVPGAPGQLVPPQPASPGSPGMIPPGQQVPPGQPPIVPRALRRLPVDQPPQSTTQ